MGISVKKNRLANLLMGVGFITMTAFSATPVNAAEVFKSVGAHGEPRYSQLKPRDAEVIEVIQLRSDGRREEEGEMSGKTNTPQAPQMSEIEQQNRMINDRLRKQQEQGIVRKCQALRNNLTNLNIGGKIYEMDDNGNKKYLSDNDINSKKDKIRQTISQYCPS